MRSCPRLPVPKFTCDFEMSHQPTIQVAATGRDSARTGHHPLSLAASALRPVAWRLPVPVL